MVADTWHCTATLIAPDRVLTAGHCAMAGGEAIDLGTDPIDVIFRRRPDGGLGRVEDGFDSFYRVGVQSWILPADGSDVAVAVLEHPVEHITPMTVALYGTLFDEQGGTIWGWGREGTETSSPQRELRHCSTSFTHASDGENISFPSGSSASRPRRSRRSDWSTRPGRARTSRWLPSTSKSASTRSESRSRCR